MTNNYEQTDVYLYGDQQEGYHIKANVMAKDLVEDMPLEGFPGLEQEQDLIRQQYK